MAWPPPFNSDAKAFAVCFDILLIYGLLGMRALADRHFLINIKNNPADSCIFLLCIRNSIFEIHFFRWNPSGSIIVFRLKSGQKAIRSHHGLCFDIWLIEVPENTVRKPHLVAEQRGDKALKGSPGILRKLGLKNLPVNGDIRHV